MSNLENICPLDGRYQKDLKLFQEYFSESALITYRAEVEKKYLISLLKLLKKVSVSELKKISQIKIDPAQVKKIESITNHDVKAVEYYLKEELKELKFKDDILELVHFALTSEDINNLAYSLMWKDALEKIYLPELNKTIKELKKLAQKHKDQTILSMTHGQPATPTTLGKEMAVFSYRLNRQLKFSPLLGKLAGATSNWAAHYVAYPDIDWFKFSKKFVESLDLKLNPLTIQIESHDSLAEHYHQVIRINNILKDFSRDMWLYISRGIFKQKIVKGEVGSSTMPHKVNPIRFENAEGNLGMSTAIFDFMANKLPISRMQRDLSDSTVLRNQGLALGYSFLALQNLVKGLARVEVNNEKIKEELDNNWDVLAEPIQTVLRKLGYSGAYEKLKKLTRGQKLNQEILKEFIDDLEIPAKEKKELKKLTPFNYNGISAKLIKYIK
jgi:adenylosuccinate lyase